MLVRTTFAVLLACLAAASPAQFTTQPTPQAWHAEWIAAPTGPSRDQGVLYFRKSLNLSAVPAHFLVNVSADNRFELHVNGKRVGAGPALSDVRHWRYETFDLAPFLAVGQNDIAAIVWNFGAAAPINQLSSQTAFVLAAEDHANSSIDTGESWKILREPGRTAAQPEMRDYYAAAPGEVMDGSKMNWNWDSPTSAQPDAWTPAHPIGRAAVTGTQDSPTPWILEPDPLPAMRYEPISPGHIVHTTGIEPPTTLDHPIAIPANTSITLLLDRDALTTAFPSLTVTGGSGAAITLTYAEALIDTKDQKGNRNEIAGRHIAGIADRILPDGSTRTYRTLWWRTWRYLQLDIKTAAQPLTLHRLDAFYTAYPFTKLASFESDDPQLSQIWDVGWRTAQLCAHETYMDTPYWEQLQYVGDTRIQALLSYAVTGDDRLARQALTAYRNSLLTNGLTQSRYPSSLTQVIPPFSLLWVGMLHDFWMYRDDPAFAASLLPGTRGVIDWFSARQRPDGLLGHIEWWPFVDWSPPAFVSGVPPQQPDGGSSALTLQFIEAVRNAADLEQAFGDKFLAQRYRAQADRAAAALMKLNWDRSAQLLADTPEKKTFSQQANALAVWLDVIPHTQQRTVMQKVLASSTQPSQTVPMAQASYYFRFYLARAMVHAGLGDQYIAQLDPWRQMLSLGLSTWAETPEPTRSDSHAWSAHPTFDLLTLVAGIAPASPGFHTIAITPHLGPLPHASATMPTPQGLVQVRYTRLSTGWKSEVTLPPGLSGTLHWHDQALPLHPGHQTLTLR